MIVLAGAPSGDGFMRGRPSWVNDPVGLLALVRVVPDVVEQVLRSMVPGPAACDGPRAATWCRPGDRRSRPRDRVVRRARCGCFLTVIRSWRPGSCGLLILQLSSDVFDRENGTGGLKRTLSAMLSPWGR